MFSRQSLASVEFPKVLRRIAGFVHSEASERAALDLQPLEEREEIERRLDLVAEIRRLSDLGIALRLVPFANILPLLEAVRPQGAILDPTELVLFIPFLEILRDLDRQFSYREDIPLLQSLSPGLPPFPDLLEELETSFDSEGNILDSASPLLYDLRSRKRSLTARIRKRLDEIVRERDISLFLQDEFVTIRNGRWVIPVRMDSKGMVAGIVHDVSNSGETAFMEPREIVPLANELENLAAEEKAEMYRILRTITAYVRSEAASLEETFWNLVRLDLLNAIARLAELLRGTTPQLADRSELRIISARHPLLMLLKKERGETVVPLDLALGREDTVMIITGPNAGGKTIALKTAGLLLAMALTGIPVPAAEGSVFPLARDLLVDIGDEQSIEESLSTFSAHIATISGILSRSDGRTVVLMDELGTGTEPVQGGALSCAILKELRDRGALVLATTHLTAIAGFAHRENRMVNASMEFDPKTRRPLYRLRSGEPGQSHAFEIAAAYGLPEPVLEYARGMLGRMDTEFHDLLRDLREKTLAAEDLRLDAERRLAGVEERERLLERLRAEAEERRRESVEKGLAEAREIVRSARRDVADIVAEAKKGREQDARRRLEEKSREVEESLRELRPEPLREPGVVREGEMVHVLSLGTDARVLSVDQRHRRVRVKAGNVEFEAPIEGVTAPRGKAVRETPGLGKRKRTFEAEPEHELRLNLLGSRVEEALPAVETFLNRASMTGSPEIAIVHGIGSGALRRAVREYLERHPLVAGFRSGSPAEGGDGVTMVTIR
jgi:DNA mismatch repair protein MutS2